LDNITVSDNRAVQTFSLATGATNAPSQLTTLTGATLVQYASGAGAVQVVYANTQDYQYMRRKTGGSWTPWTRAAFSGYDVFAQSAVASSHTGNTTETTLGTINVPARAMGANGRLRITALFSYTNSANVKTLRFRFGGVIAAIGTQTTTNIYRAQIEIANRNSVSSQIVSFAGTGAGWGSNTFGSTSLTVDTDDNAAISITGQLASSGETVTLESYTVELMSGG
jgi:hypothetical protein